MRAAPLTDAERAELRRLVAVERARAQRRLSSLERTFDEMVDAADLEPPDDEHRLAGGPITGGYPLIGAPPSTARSRYSTNAY